MKIERNKAWWLAKISNEPDCPITAGVPDERDRLWTIQQLAAVGVEETNGTGPLADLFAAIHREAASGLASSAPIQNLSSDPILPALTADAGPLEAMENEKEGDDANPS